MFKPYAESQHIAWTEARTLWMKWGEEWGFQLPPLTPVSHGTSANPGLSRASVLGRPRLGSQFHPCGRSAQQTAGSRDTVLRFRVPRREVPSGTDRVGASLHSSTRMKRLGQLLPRKGRAHVTCAGSLSAPAGPAWGAARG